MTARAPPSRRSPRETWIGTRCSPARIGSTSPASPPALSEGAARETLAAVKAAKAHGVTVSCDLNYRKNLWSREEAGRVMGEIVPMVDVLIANEEDAADVFGIHAAETDISAGKLNVEGYRSVASQLVERFGCKLVAITLRESISASDNNWSGMLYDGADGGDVCLQEVRHPPGGPPGRRRFLRLRPDLRAPERLQPAGGRGVRRGGLCAQADHRGATSTASASRRFAPSWAETPPAACSADHLDEKRAQVLRDLRPL